MLGLLSWSCWELPAQILRSFPTEHLTVSSGLSSNSIYTLFQDAQGFIWIGTANGLNRYDGYECIAYQHLPSDSTTLSDNLISDITQAQDGSLWIGTQGGGVDRYDIEQERFAHYPDDSLSSTYVYKVWTDAAEHLWVGTDMGLEQIALTKPFPKGPVLSSLSIHQGVESVIRDQQGNVWMGSGSGLYVLPAGTSSGIQSVAQSLDTGPIKTLLMDRRGRIWVGAKKGLFWIKNGELASVSANFQSQTTPTVDVVALAESEDGKLWIAERNGLKTLDLYGTGPASPAAYQSFDHLVKGSILSSLLFDREGNLWVGTANSGIIRLFISRKHFPLFRHNPEASALGTAKNTIRAIFEDQDSTLWIGTYGAGLFHMDRSGHTLHHFTHDPQDPHSLPGDIISCVYRDQKGILWVGTWEDGLAQAFMVKGRIHFKHFHHEAGVPGSLSYDDIQQLFEDEYGNLWVVTNGGIDRFDPQTGQFDPVSRQIDYESRGINRVIEDGQHRWWIGSWNGLYVLDTQQVKQLKTGQAVTKASPAAVFTYEKTDTISLSNNRVTSLLEDRQGRIWIGTYGGGLNLWKPGDSLSAASLQDGRFSPYGKEAGLSNAVIYGILEDKQGAFWLSTNNGLVRFDPDSATFQSFTEADGLQNNYFYFGAFAKTRGEELLFGGINGFNLINTDSLPLSLSVQPKAMLVDFLIRGESAPIGFRADGTTVMEESISQHPDIQLQPEDNAFVFKFSALSFEHASTVMYAYRMRDYEGSWQQTDANNRFAAYSNLPHGTYQFEVRASLDGQQWGPIQALSVEILPRWYQTSWARLLFVLILVGLFILVSVLSTSFAQLKNNLVLEKLQREKEKEIYDTKAWFYTFISHEFRTPITLIHSPLAEIMRDRSIPAFVKEKVDLAFRSGRRLLFLVNQFLSFRTAESGKLQLEAAEGNMVDFVYEIFLSFSKPAQQRRMRYQFSAEPEEILVWYDRDKMDLLIYNLLGNAFKYTPDGGTIQVEIRKEAQAFCLKVTDTGRGISAERLPHIFDPFFRAAEEGTYGSGIGLTLARQVAELHGGKIEVESELGKGSTFWVRLPLGRAHLDESQLLLQQAESEPLQSPLPEGSEMEPEEMASLFGHLSNEDRPSLLLVEDNEDIRSYMRSHFEAKFEVYEAANGLEGLEAAKAHIPDLIISDVMMPKMDGLSMCTRLKEEVLTSHIPVILLSARTSTVHQIEGLQKGGYAYVTKPFDINILKAKVIAIFKNLRKLHEYYEKELFLTATQHQADNSAESQFVYKAASVVERHLADKDFDVDDFAQEMGVSRSGLYKKLQALTGRSTTNFIRYIRLRHAEKLMKSSKLNIAEISYRVGFNNPRYFRKCYREEFGHSPSEERAWRS
ncbi:MAG: two-component regulator propeller domain-containing protein [Bacteroidota bacterium]